MTLLFHLYNHAGSDEEASECGVDTIPAQLHWDSAYTVKMIRFLERDGYVQLLDGLAKLTEEGRNASIRNYNALFAG